MADPEKEDPIDDKAMPLLDHLIELRKRLIWSMSGFMLFFFVSYYFSGQIFEFLAQPLANIYREMGVQRHMIYTALTEAFFTHLKVAFFGGAFLGFPLIATQLWLFIAPGLYRSEKKAFAPFLIASPILFLLGAALAYYFIFPVAWKFFISFEAPGADGTMAIESQPKVAEYLDLVMKLIFAFGLAFQLPVALSLMAKVGIISSKGLMKYRRYAYVGMFIIAAILAPPDVITQIGLALPLIGLYELSIIAARIVEPKRSED